MSDDEVDELLKAVDTSSGEINYTGKHTSSSLYPTNGIDLYPGMILGSKLIPTL